MSVTQWPCSAHSGKSSRILKHEWASRNLETDLEDAWTVVEAEFEDARRPVADARPVLESELEQEHAALEEEYKRTTKLEGRLWHFSSQTLSHSLHGGARVGARAGTVGCGSSGGAREDGGGISG